MRVKKSIILLASLILILISILPLSKGYADSMECGIEVIPAMSWEESYRTYFKLWANNCGGHYWELKIDDETMAYDDTSIMDFWSKNDNRTLLDGNHYAELNIYFEPPGDNPDNPFEGLSPVISKSISFEIWEHYASLDIEDQYQGQDIECNLVITNPNSKDCEVFIEKNLGDDSWGAVDRYSFNAGGDDSYIQVLTFGKDLFEEGHYRAGLRIDYYMKPYSYFDILIQQQNKDNGGVPQQSSGTIAQDRLDGDNTDEAGIDIYSNPSEEELSNKIRKDAINKENNSYGYENPYPNIIDPLNTTVAIFVDRVLEKNIGNENAYYEIEGWAIDTNCSLDNGHEGTGIEFISIYDCENKLLNSALYGKGRKDVADIYGSNYFRSGFNANVAVDDLKKGFNELLIYAYAPSINSWSKTDIIVFLK